MMTTEEKIKSFNASEGTWNITDGYSCPICKNKGVILKLDEDNIERVMPCQCQKTRETLRKARHSGMGNLLDYTFDDFIATEEWQKNIKDTAEKFCGDDSAHWFYIGGQVGCGKTLICSIISAFYIKEGKSLKYMLWNEDTKKLKQNINEKEYQHIIKDYYNADVLYIDDFLKTRQGKAPSDADIGIAFDIVNRRMREPGKITIISSEKFMDELLNYDEATMSRVYEKAGYLYTLNIPRDKKRNYRLNGVRNTEEQ